MNVGLRLIVPRELMDNAVALTYACGAQGIQWVDAEDGGPPPGTVWVHVWHEESTIDAQIRRYCEDLGPQAKVERIEPVNEELTLDAPRVFSLTDGYSVHCIHGQSTPLRATDLHHQNHGVIHLEWGAGFGLGDHPTTRITAQALVWALDHLETPKVADIGTGTGILCILAALKGARVWATDIEDIARSAAERNAIRNGVQAHFQVGEALPEDTQFHLVTANLYLGPVMNLAPRLHRWIQPGGWCILSGFGPRYADTVLSAYAHFGWRQADIYREGDWVALVLQWHPPDAVFVQDP